MLGRRAVLSRNITFLRSAPISFVLLVLSAGVAPAANTVQSHPKRVLILYSYDREEGIFADFDRAFRSELSDRFQGRVEFFTEYLDMVRFNSPQHAHEVATLLAEKYSKLKPDVVVPVSFPALTFVLGEGRSQKPFSDVPVVTLFNTQNPDAIRLAALNRNVEPGLTGVATMDEPTRTLDFALKLQPDTKRVVIITGSSPREQVWLQDLQGSLLPYQNQIEFLYLNGMSMELLLQKLRSLPPHTIILYTYFFEDANGQFWLPEEALDLFSQASPVPIYGVENTYIGHGVVGGHMTSASRAGSLAADSASRVLNGDQASSIPITADDSGQDTVDWRQLRRWNISEKQVPAGTAQLFREPSPWERYRVLILAIVGLALLETALVVALIINLGKLKRADRALLREKTLAESVIESLPGLFVMQDESGRNVRWNKNSEQTARFDLRKVSNLENVAEYDREAARQARKRVLMRGHDELEADMLNSGGGVTPYYWNARRVELEDKQYITAIGIDLTPRKQAEVALRRSEAQLRSFVENAPYGIGRVSAKTDRFLSANPALVKMLGYGSEKELLSVELSRDLYVEGRSPEFRAQLTRADHFNGIEFAWKRRDRKSITVRASGRRLPGEDAGDILEIIVEDVTNRRSLEEQLRHTQKMEALGQLAGSVAHDFNNLLAVIIGHCELLSSALGDSGPARARVEIIENAGKRAASLTSQLLAFSRRQVMQTKTLNLNSLVVETHRMLQHLMGEDVKHKLDLDDNIGMVKADPGQLVQVIMNLSVNARDAMPNGGVLTISTASVRFQEPTVMQSVVVPAGAYVLLSVQDKGIGMDVDTHEHIFEPFFTTKPVGKGTGLGLATVFGIVKQSGGFIFAESELGKGTVFKIYLPQIERVSAGAEIQPKHSTNCNSGTILVVEDEAAFRDLLVEGLQAAGYQVLTGENGVDGLHIANQHIGKIDLLLTDVIMPQMNGPDLARFVKEVHPLIKVLYMSGYTDDKLHAISADKEVALLQKPFFMQDLLQKIAEVSQSATTSG